MENTSLEALKKAVRDGLLCIDDIDTGSSTELTFSGRLMCDEKITGTLHDNYLHIRFFGSSFTGTFILEDGGLRYFLFDTSNYIYLPLEKKVVPKALSSGISKDRRQKATVHNCYITIPHDSPEITPGFISEYIYNLIKNFVT